MYLVRCWFRYVTSSTFTIKCIKDFLSLHNNISPSKLSIDLGINENSQYSIRDWIFTSGLLYEIVTFIVNNACSSSIMLAHHQFLFLLFLLESWKGTLTSETIFGNWKSFKNEGKGFLFHLKSSFFIFKFCLDYLVQLKNSLMRKVRLISKFMTSQPAILVIIFWNFTIF